MKKKISIHDIAKALDLSATTISFVLNGKADEKKISADVQRKVSDFFSGISRGIETIAYNHQYKIFFASTENEPSLNTSTVIIDNFSGSYQAVKHLQENGFSNIAFITADAVIFAINYLAINGAQKPSTMKNN